MWLWAGFFVVLVLAGLAVLAKVGLGLVRDVRHLGRAVGDASARLAGAAADLAEAAEPLRDAAREREGGRAGEDRVVPGARRA